MAAERVGSSPGGQGKAVPVEEMAVQLSLPVATAENPQGATRRRTRDRLGVLRAGAPKATDKAGMAAPATMEEVANRLTSALLKVASNKGAPGPDGQTIERLLEQWSVVLPKLQADLLAGSYQPGAIRRRYIPKAGGGQRGLGIPDVIDRVVQEAARQVLEPLWEPTFHPSSHGFRPGRSCHSAIAEAIDHLEGGYEWCVDLDLEKFFDLVCHQRLAAKLAERVSDRRLLMLIGRMLKAKVVLPDGVVIDSEQGVPQGGPLSPLLSNVVLDEFDQELARRGHRFVRYADDGVPRTLKEDRCRRRYRRCGAAREMKEPGRLVWWPFAVALQGEIANHREVRRSRAGVLSVAEKARYQRVRCGSRRRAKAIPPLKCRKRIGDIQNRGRVVAPGSAWREPADWPGGCPAWMVARA
jgi:retron-type reverse transcriptase